jgi:hypothetical protein
VTYLATFFNAEYGDIEHVQPAETFDDGVAAVLARIPASEYLEVDVRACTGGMCRLAISRGGTILAVVEDVVPAAPVGVGARHIDVVEACNSLSQGSAEPLKALFKASRQGAQHG